MPNSKLPCHIITHSFPNTSLMEMGCLSRSSNLLFLARLISRRQTRLSRSANTDTLLGEARAVNRAIEALLNVVPAHDALEMGAKSAELLDVAVLVLVNGDGLLGGLFPLSASLSRE